MSFGRMSEPLTKVQKVDSTTTAKSYNFAYKYEDSNHPTAPIQIGHDHYTYDANGNPTLIWRGALLGGLSAAATYGIGSIFNGVGTFGHELLRAGAHGLSSGVFNALNGDNF